MCDFVEIAALLAVPQRRLSKINVSSSGRSPSTRVHDDADEVLGVASAAPVLEQRVHVGDHDQG
jgi:hypothetical protein